jgi:hypothetical protein
MFKGNISAFQPFKGINNFT